MLALLGVAWADNEKGRRHGSHHRDCEVNNGQHRREGYLHNNGRPCKNPHKPCVKPCIRIGSWKERPCGFCPVPEGVTAVTVSNRIILVPVTAKACDTTVLTTVVPTVVCTTFVIPGADNANCKGERNAMVEDLINKYATGDAVVFLNGQEIEVAGGGVTGVFSSVVRSGVVTITGVSENAAAEQSMAGTLAAIVGMLGLAMFAL